MFDKKQKNQFNWLQVLVMTILLCCITPVSVNAESYTKKVGEVFILPIPQAPVKNSYLNSWSYSCSSSKVNIKNTDGLGEVTITSYFEGSVTIECFLSYTIVYSNGNMHAGTSREYHTLRCEGNDIIISAPRPKMAVGETMQLNYRFASSSYNVTPNIKWNCGSSTAIVDQFGMVTALRAGEATITASSNLGGNVASVKIIIEKIDPISVYIPSAITMTSGESRSITPTLSPSNAQTSYTWSTSNPSVITVASGTIKALRYGNSIVTVRTSNGLSSSCQVTVNKSKLKIFSSLQSGLYEKGTVVELRSDNSNATIYYTTDGSNPTERSNKYVEPIKLQNSTQLRAVAIHNDYISSEIINLDIEITSLKVIKKFPDNSDKNVSDFNRPFIEFNSILKDVNKSNLKFTVDGKQANIECTIYDKKLYLFPEGLDSKGKHVCKILIPEYSLLSSSGDTNIALEYAWETVPHDEVDICHPISIHAGEKGSLYITSDKVLHYWGALSSSGVNSMHEYPNAIKGVCTGSLIAYIDTDHNLWVAGTQYLLDNFGSIPRLYAKNVSDIALNGALFYVTDDECLYGVGRDTSYELMGKGTKSNRYGEKYSDTPILLAYNVKSVFAGDNFVLALMNTGQLGGWGTFSGNSNEQYKTPKPIDYGVKSASILGGIARSLPIYLKEDGTAWQVTETTNLMKVRKFAENVKMLEGNSNRGYYITNNGELFGWGTNSNFRLGDYFSYEGDDYFKSNNRFINSEGAVRIKESPSGNVRYETISVSEDYAIALSTDGDIYGWGNQSVDKEFCHSEIIDYSTNPVGSSVLFIYPNMFLKSKRNPDLKDLIVPEELEVCEDSKFIIPIQTEPLDGTFDNIEWESSNDEIADIINDGILHAKSIGECDINITIRMSNYIIDKKIRIKVVGKGSSKVDNIDFQFDDTCIIIDLNGNMVFNGKLGNCPQLPHGIYIMRIKDRSLKFIR
ncbi:MAG: chitobiase/beta-hexosaminidase C-terminal domain-containing protein [Staphylococcus sp.]|nr:chitobiase/beta-hexosaminidase C-terminal domain-containing protein [Staphylococcus sp.]